MFEQKYIDKFWKKVDKGNKDECWRWAGGTKTPKGYGMLDVNYKKIYAHRVSYMIHFGEIPEGLLVCHKCDNPGCVNPSHLWLGTHTDNLKDASVKGRWVKGLKCSSLDIINVFRSRKYRNKISIARSLGIPPNRVYRIIKKYKEGNLKV